MKILFLGDVVGISGCSKLMKNLLNEIKSKKTSLMADYINIDEHNDLFVNYFDKFREFLIKNPLKIFTKDIIEFKF